jgi:hypothetical protein
MSRPKRSSTVFFADLLRQCRCFSKPLVCPRALSVERLFLSVVERYRSVQPQLVQTLRHRSNGLSFERAFRLHPPVKRVRQFTRRLHNDTSFPVSHIPVKRGDVGLQQF